MTEMELRRAWIVRGAGLCLGGAATAIGAGAAVGAAQTAGQASRLKKEPEDEDVSANEDLMREHGVLKRVLLIYREIIRRIDTRTSFPPQTLASSARLVRSFVEDYHEKIEEDFLFPRFRKAGKHLDLVDVLYRQHQKGRTLTDQTLQSANAEALKDDHRRAALRNALFQFVRMYEPHEAREDTVLFPAFHKLVSAHEYASLGEEFEKKERTMFHGDGFDMAVDQVASIEKELDIYDLNRFTPTV
jgi:hemerythrin-like domain-containing protein